MLINEQIYTSRTLIRSLSEEDNFGSYLKWVQDKVNNQYIMGVSEKYTELELRNYVRVKNLSKSAMLLGIFEKSTMLHIGNIKYEPIDFHKRFSWMGILLGEVAYRNMGLAGEVILASSHFLKEKYCINKLKLGVSERNLHAISAYRKIGFNVESVSDLEHQLIMAKNLN